MICIKLFELCRTFLFAQRLADSIDGTLMVFQLFRMVVYVYSRYAGGIQFCLHIGLILLFQIKRNKNDIRI